MTLHLTRLKINQRLSLPLSEIDMSAIRAQGAGGQHVNKVSSAIHLRFDIKASSLPDHCKARLLSLGDQRITRDGIIVIKAQSSRSRDMNREEALSRLCALIDGVMVVRKRRVPTRVSRAKKQQRLDQKNRRGKDKKLRRRVRVDD